MSQKVTFSKIIEELARQTGTTETLSRDFVSSLTDLVISSSIESGKASITNFGSFSVVNVAARNGVNPQTGQTIVIPSHQRLSFTPYKALESTVNAPYAHLEATIIEEEAPQNIFSPPIKEADKKFIEETPEKKGANHYDFDDPFHNLGYELEEKSNDETIIEPDVVDENEVIREPEIEETSEEESTDPVDNDAPFHNLDSELDKEPSEEAVVESQELPDVVDETEVEEEAIIEPETKDEDTEEENTDPEDDDDDDDPFHNLEEEIDKESDDETEEDDKKDVEEETERLKTIPIIIGIVFFLIVIVAGFWFFMFRDSTEPELADQTPIETPIEESTTEDEEAAPNQEQNSGPTPNLEEVVGEEMPAEAGVLETTPIVAQSHIVERNEWFYDIARRTYIKPTFWPLIFEANFTVSQDPDIVLTGQNLEIPSIENAQNPTPNDRARVARAAKLVSDAYANAGKTEKANAYARMAVQFSN